MRLFAYLRRIWNGPRELIGLQSKLVEFVQSHVALQKNFNELQERHASLVVQVGLQQQATLKQLVDLRTILASQREDAKQNGKPHAAHSMADVRRFLGDEENL